MRNSLRIGLAAICALSSVGLRSASSAPTIPREWEAFRSKFPHHIQGVALSEPRADGTRVLIVAEPPPHVTLASLRALSPALANLQTTTQHIGHDGWVKDAVVTLAPSDDRTLSSLCQKINRHLFGTSYKAYVLGIPDKILIPPTVMPPARYQLDYRISAAELQKWVLTDQELFQPVEGGAPRTLVNAPRERNAGVFLSEAKGLVAWVIPDGADLQDYAIEAREFALDSDLILGALAAEGCKVVFARERAIPVDEMPPLRAETLTLLAAANTYHLAQSYERTNAFAGRFDETRDWAPIFLSSQLMDTEYGSLLNVTDQLLKSWSNCGVTEYENFRYSKPDHWPFAKPILMELGVHQIVYNWNTKGAGYKIDYGAYALFALNRTGALPVSYIPSGGSGPEAISKAEDSAYEFFANMGDPNLARVVQYAALYQIFTNFGITASGGVAGESDRHAAPFLEAEAGRLLTILKGATKEQLREFAAHMMRRATDADFREVIDSERTFFEKEILRHALTEKDYEILVPLIRKFLTTENFNFLQKAQTDLREANSEDFREFVSTVIDNGMEPEYKDYASFLRAETDLNALRERVVASKPPKDGTWVHTPAVVVSFNTAAMAKAVGGHNLDAEISLFHTSKDVRAGEIKLETSTEGVPVLLCNESDVAKVSALVRKVGRNSDDLAKVFPEIQAELKVMPALPIPSQKKALGFASDRSTPAERGLQPTLMPKVAGVETGWQPRPVSTAGLERLRPYALDSPSALVEYRILPDGRHEVSYVPPANTTGALVTSTNEAGEVADIIQVYLRKHADANQPPTIVFRGTTPDEAYAMMKQLEFGQAKMKTRPLRISASEKMEPVAVMKAVHAEYDFSKAKIERVGNKIVGGRNELTFELKLPALAQARPTLTMRFKIIFEKILSPEIVAEIQTRISNLLARLTQHRLVDLHFQLHKELDPLLRVHGGQPDFLLQIDTEKGDLIITLRPVQEKQHCNVAYQAQAG